MKITDIAKEKLMNAMADQPGKVVRIHIASIGWGGPRLGLVLDEPKSDDVVEKINEIQVYFDKTAKGFADNIILDLKNDNFILKNPFSSCC